MQLAIMFSNTASTVVKLAKVRNRKNRAPHSRPPVMLTNTRGRVIKNQGWSLAGFQTKAEAGGEDDQARSKGHKGIQHAHPGGPRRPVYSLPM